MRIFKTTWEQWQGRSKRTANMLALALIANGAGAEIFISEIHYDNAGADTGEAIELSGPVGSSLNGWQLVLYNGNGGSSYGSIDIEGSLQAVDDCSEGYAVFNRSGIQNGSPDGIALVDDSGTVVEFLSYEGSFVAVGGPADGISALDIGVSESSSTEIGFSLQKIDGTWQAPAENTFGGCEAQTDTPTNPAMPVKIHDIQGTGSSVAINQVVNIDAIVTADYQESSQLRGFFVQEEDTDTDDNPLSSEGIFVNCQSCPVDVAVGDRVRVTGLAQDSNGMSEIRATFTGDIEIVSSANPLPSPATVNLPIPLSAADLEGAENEVNAYFEPYEGMLINIPQTLSVAEYVSLGRFGQVLLTANGRPRQFTDQHIPSEAGYLAHQIDIQARSIILDDDSSSQNTALVNDVPVFYPQPGLSIDNYFRGGDSIENLTGVLQFAFSEWRVRPLADQSYSFTRNNHRTEKPEDVGGSLKVASFNVLNYFTTLDENNARCAPNLNLECRGADSAAELYRQTQKIVAAVCAMDADIIGLMELENPNPQTQQAPIDTLAEAINAECGDYAAVETGSLGTDAITVGFLYKTATVGLDGSTAILDSTEFTDPNNSGVGKNRPAVAQSFVELAKNASLTVAVNHLKSKGSSCGQGDDDRSTGQGNCNATRTAAAQALAAWLATKPTGVESDYTLIIGDLNAYRNEDPIRAFENAGYVDVIDLFGGSEAYGYLFAGQLGYLDHGLANASLLPYITGATDWHINADEINLFDYNDTIRDASEASFEAKPSATALFAPHAYRSSDHDPLVIGIDLPDNRSLAISDLIDTFNRGYDAGKIRGKGFGPFENLFAFFFVRDLSAADWYYRKGKIAKACTKLTKAYQLSDGKKRPRDTIKGAGVAALNQDIQKVIQNLNCQ